ncbi:hypothetical protein [Pendulispora albinea]|uniref:Uncharacterized protein n=1 Tax=Pendulispora albinea TaxID=2741071 RepID=A0ABZ2LT27_9BACT
MLKNRFVVMLPFSLLAAACSVQSSGQSNEPLGAVQQPEVWSAKDDPSLFSSDLVRVASALPTSGEVARIPWAGSYWPTYKDSINYRWAGPSSASPAKKYELAFGGADVEDAVSRYHGIDAHSNARSCTRTSQCDASLGESCARRAGEGRGYCIPTWFGICHAWAPAAILVPEPEHAVVSNGVTFEVQDIKALISLVHEGTTVKFVSLRCNDSDENMSRDEDGRPRSACRDTNPGTLHILLANYLGIKKQSFVEDRTFDYQVWNQPLRGYRILEQEEITSREANALVVEGSGAASDRYKFNPDAVSFLHVKTEVQYITETSPREGNVASRIDDYTQSSHYEYVLELDARGAIIGGEWVGRSKSNHPDFLWLPVRQPPSTVAAGGAITYTNVKALANASITP